MWSVLWEWGRGDWHLPWARPRRSPRDLSWFLEKMNGVFISYACWNKLQTFGGVQTTLFSYNSEGQKSEVSLMGLKSKCCQGWLFLEIPGENRFLSLPASCGFRSALPAATSCLISLSCLPLYVQPPLPLLQGHLSLH